MYKCRKYSGLHTTRCTLPSLSFFAHYSLLNNYHQLCSRLNQHQLFHHQAFSTPQQFNFTPLHWFSEGFLITFSQHTYNMLIQKTFGCSYTSSVFVRECVKKLPSLKPQCYHNHRILNSALSSVGLLLIAEAMPVGGLPVILLLSPWLGITFSLLIQPIAAQMAKNVRMGFKTALLWTHPPPEAWTVQVWGSSDVARISQILFGPILGRALNVLHTVWRNDKIRRWKKGKRNKYAFIEFSLLYHQRQQKFTSFSGRSLGNLLPGLPEELCSQGFAMKPSYLQI